MAGRRDGVKSAHEVMAPIAQALVEEQQIVDVAAHFAAANRGSRMKAPRRTDAGVGYIRRRHLIQPGRRAASIQRRQR